MPNGAVSGDAHWTRQHPEKVPRGENHPRAALRGLMRRTALEMLAGGRSIRCVARDLGVSRRAVETAAKALPRILITEHAIDRYIERIRPTVTRGQALSELVKITTGAHPVKEIEPGLWLWRGPTPRRLRLRVDARVPSALRLVTVLTAHDGMTRHLR